MIRWSRDTQGHHTEPSGRFTIRRRTDSWSGLKGSRGAAVYVSFDLYDGEEKIAHGDKLKAAKWLAEAVLATEQGSDLPVHPTGHVTGNQREVLARYSPAEPPEPAGESTTMHEPHRCDHDAIHLEANPWHEEGTADVTPRHALRFTSGNATNSVALTDRDVQAVVDQLHAAGWRPSGTA